MSPNLTKNQQIVLDLLDSSDGPLTAYSMLDSLRDKGFRAPPQIYRALEKLTGLGLVHRLESLNAFIACSQHDCEGHDSAAFTICQQCGHVEEIADSRLAGHLQGLAKDMAFTLQKSTLELRGLCRDCH